MDFAKEQKGIEIQQSSTSPVKNVYIEIEKKRKMFGYIFLLKCWTKLSYFKVC